MELLAARDLELNEIQWQQELDDFATGKLIQARENISRNK